MLIASGALLLSIMLPWVKVGTLTLNGIDTEDGQMIAVGAVVMLILSALQLNQAQTWKA